VWLDRPEVETWVALSGGSPAGYFELEHQDFKNRLEDLEKAAQ